jgi:hypothetical protein
MVPSHYQLLANCTDEQLREICLRRKLPLPQHWQEGAEGRMRLLKTMVFHLEDNKLLTNTLLDLGSRHLRALKSLAETGEQPGGEVQDSLAGLGLILPDGDLWRTSTTGRSRSRPTPASSSHRPRRTASPWR